LGFFSSSFFCLLISFLFFFLFWSGTVLLWLSIREGEFSILHSPFFLCLHFSTLLLAVMLEGPGWDMEPVLLCKGQLTKFIFHTNNAYKGTTTYSQRKASASSINRRRPLLDFLAQSNSWCIFVTACDPSGATSPPVMRA
jgi:hypothetical protein